MSLVRSIPAIPFEALDPAVTEALRPKFERLGYLGEFFQRTAHQPEPLRRFIDFTESARACVAPNLAALIALTVSTSLGSEYERNQHERLAVREGLGRTWVEQVERLAPLDANLTSAERATQSFVLAAVADVKLGASRALEELVTEVGVREAIGVLFVAGRSIAHAFIANSLGLRPPVPSIFEDGFDGT